MRKCACGKHVRPNEINAVKIYDRRSGELKRIICGECAGRSNGPKGLQRKKKKRRAYFSQEDFDD